MKTVKNVLKIFISISLVFSFVAKPIYAAEANYDACKQEKQKAEVVYEADNGNKVTKVSKDGKEIFVVTSEPIISRNVTDDEKKELTESKESIVTEKVYIELTDTLENAKQIADTPPVNDSSQIATASTTYAFWHGSSVERVWDWWYGDGTHGHLSPVDTNYVTNMGWVSADSLASALVIAGVLDPPAGLAFGAILTVGVLTKSWNLQIDDGSIDITAYDNNILPALCVKAGQYLGQAISRTGFLNYYWGSLATTVCY